MGRRATPPYQWSYDDRAAARTPTQVDRVRPLQGMDGQRRTRAPRGAAAPRRARAGRAQTRAPACAIDAQSVKTAHTVPTATQGMDPGKKIVGRRRRRSVVVDTFGLRLAVMSPRPTSRTTRPTGRS